MHKNVSHHYKTNISKTTNRFNDSTALVQEPAINPCQLKEAINGVAILESSGKHKRAQICGVLQVKVVGRLQTGLKSLVALVQHAQRLLERLLKVASNSLHFTDRLHG